MPAVITSGPDYPTWCPPPMVFGVPYSFDANGAITYHPMGYPIDWEKETEKIEEHEEAPQETPSPSDNQPTTTQGEPDPVSRPTDLPVPAADFTPPTDERNSPVDGCGGYVGDASLLRALLPQWPSTGTGIRIDRARPDPIDPVPYDTS